MNIPQNTATRNRSEFAKSVAARYRRRVKQAEMANQRRAIHSDPATGRIQAINIRHS